MYGMKYVFCVQVILSMLHFITLSLLVDTYPPAAMHLVRQLSVILYGQTQNTS